MPVLAQGMEFHLSDGVALFGAAEQQNADSITTEALVFYSGTHSLPSGETLEVPEGRINEIVFNSNARMGERRTQLYLDHSGARADGTYKAVDALGEVGGQFYSRRIEEPGDIPFEKPALFEKLKGRVGVFVQAVIKGRENVEKYRLGLLKEVSVGINLAKNVIFEVSVTGEQVLPGAALFSLEFGGSLKTLSSEKSLDNTFQAALRTFTTIRDASAEILQGRGRSQLYGRAISEFALELRTVFGLSPPEGSDDPPPTVPITLSATMTPDEKAELERLRSENQALRSRQSVTGLFSSVQMKAQQLLNAKILSPAVYNEYLTLNGAPVTNDDQAVQLFSLGHTLAGGVAPETAAIEGLNRLAFALELIEKNGASNSGGIPSPDGMFSIVGRQPIPQRPDGVGPQAQPEDDYFSSIVDSAIQTRVVI